MTLIVTGLHSEQLHVQLPNRLCFGGKMSNVHVAILSVLGVQALLLGVRSGHSRLPSLWYRERVTRSGAGW